MKFIALLTLSLCLSEVGADWRETPKAKGETNSLDSTLSLSLFSIEMIEKEVVSLSKAKLNISSRARLSAMNFYAEKLKKIVSLVALEEDDEHIAESLAVLKQAAQVAQKIEDPYSQASVLHSIAKALAQAGEPKHALEVAQKIEDPYSQALVLRSFAEVLAQTGDKAQALVALKQAAEVAQKIENASRQASVLRSITEDCFSITIQLISAPVFSSKDETPGKKRSSGSSAPPRRRLIIKSFTPQEKEAAKVILEMTRSAYASITQEALKPTGNGLRPVPSRRPSDLKPVPPRRPSGLNTVPQRGL